MKDGLKMIQMIVYKEQKSSNLCLSGLWIMSDIVKRKIWNSLFSNLKNNWNKPIKMKVDTFI